ncbi:MAG: DUF6766 family protein [Kribbellaceae bacterium]
MTTGWRRSWRRLNDDWACRKRCTGSPLARPGLVSGRRDWRSGPVRWRRSMQNWQSELLAVGSMAVLSIYVRQRGSAERTPVGSSH